MNLKLLLFASALVACISLGSACINCLLPACKNGELCINLPKVPIKPCLLPTYLQLLRLKRLNLIRALTCPNCKGSLDFLNPLCHQHYKIDAITSKESSEEVFESDEVVEIIKDNCGSSNDLPDNYRPDPNKKRKVCKCTGSCKHQVCKCNKTF